MCVGVSYMSGPSMIEPCHASSVVRSCVTPPASIRSASSGSDQMEVDAPMWLPSFFQSRYELPSSSVKMSGSMLPPEPVWRLDRFVPFWCRCRRRRWGSVAVAMPMHWSPLSASVAV